MHFTPSQCDRSDRGANAQIALVATRQCGCEGVADLAPYRTLRGEGIDDAAISHARALLSIAATRWTIPCKVRSANWTNRELP